VRKETETNEFNYQQLRCVQTFLRRAQYLINWVLFKSTQSKIFALFIVILPPISA
jgi:hypothetical protein